jgi:hypothetical protein
MKRTVALILALSGLAVAETKLGKPLTLTEPVPIPKLEAKPAEYVGKTVLIKGKVTEVCQMAGCWMALADTDSGRTIRIKVNDGEMVFPKESIGKTALAEGVLTKIELTKEQALARARHEADERKQRFQPNSVKTGMTIYQIQGAGAVLLD